MNNILNSSNMLSEELHKKIDEAIKANSESRQSNSLSPSMLNHPCKRHVFYKFRWAASPKEHNAQSLRIFNRGHRDEAQIIEYLKLAGIDVQHMDSNGRQFSYEALNGHVKGFMDGIITIDDTEYVLECKSINGSTFKVINQSGVKKAKLEHYIQIQLYMYFSKIHDAIYIAVNKNTDELYIEQIKYDESSIKDIIHLSAELLFAKDAPERANNTPQGYICNRFGQCEFMDVCWGTTAPKKTCRSCLHGEPYTTQDKSPNSWHCKKYLVNLNLDEQEHRAKNCSEYSQLF